MDLIRSKIVSDAFEAGALVEGAKRVGGGEFILIDDNIRLKRKSYPDSQIYMFIDWTNHKTIPEGAPALVYILIMTIKNNSAQVSTFYSEGAAAPAGEISTCQQ